MVSAKELQEVASDRAVYQHALAAIAVAAYRDGAISIGSASRLAELPLVDFIELCGELGVPILREPPGGLEAEYEALERALGER
jgi:predicted HTH domain antitoxin